MMDKNRTFVGFGFGAIQAGLFLYEAFQSGNFARLVVAEVMPDVVAALRGGGGQSGGFYRVNIAHADRIETAQVGPVQAYDPAHAADRAALIEAIAQAEEIATAVPSVKFYTADSPGSIHRLLAAGLRLKAQRGGPRAVIYAAENHNHAAEILQAQVMGEIPGEEQAAVLAQAQFLNTVIGKMSGVVTDAAQIQEQALGTVTADLPRAFLVEAFNRILISAIHFDPPFERGIRVFSEKSDLLPFEEAKLYGHNATHALAAYLGAARGAEWIADLKEIPGAMNFLRRAFIEESGQALVKKYQGVDELFTPAGYEAYADDLLERMINPFLRDAIERVGRDPERKLGWDDRLIGTIRLALQQGIAARRYAFGAAAALARIEPQLLTQTISPASLLEGIWKHGAADEQSRNEREQVLALIESAAQELRQWRASGFAALD